MAEIQCIQNSSFETTARAQSFIPVEVFHSELKIEPVLKFLLFHSRSFEPFHHRSQFYTFRPTIAIPKLRHRLPVPAESSCNSLLAEVPSVAQVHANKNAGM